MKGTESVHFVVGDGSGLEQPKKALSEIVFKVKTMLSDALDDPSTKLEGTHPKTLISMIVTNILVNLLTTAIAQKDVAIRLSMVKDVLQEINELSLHLWTSIEASIADDKTKH